MKSSGNIKSTDLNDHELTDKQSKFIDNLLAGSTSAKQCAIDAGYSPHSAKVEASRLLKHSKVLHVLHQRAKKALGVKAITALNTVSNLSQYANSEYVRLEASKDIMDRAGLREEQDSTRVLGNAIQVNIDLS
jgi:phage terminase small subunit